MPAPAAAAARSPSRHGLRAGRRRRRRAAPAPALARARARPALDAPPRSLRRAALLVVALAALAGARARARPHRRRRDRRSRCWAATPVWVLAGLGVMCASMVLRAFAWHAILRAALPDARVRRRDALQGTFIGVLMSATLPARLGEPSRALVVARRLGRARERLPVVLGTIVSQTLLNILALVILGATMLSTVDLFRNNRALVGVTDRAARRAALRARRARAAARRAGTGARRARRWPACAQGLRVFRSPRLGRAATALSSRRGRCSGSCWLLLVALGLDDRAGIGAAAAVLFAVNVTAVMPATPSNLGVFQAACVVVLRRLRRRPGRRAGLRDHPAGGGDRDRRRHGRAGAREGRAVVARGPRSGPSMRRPSHSPQFQESRHAASG